ncbi:unnamed protein product [Psylliodes chrysocephalus]|uniref:Uncharacterized protein n=1 Tax=Psylliodes chrysocephalus TaxID=3402493 RepID=A0A9P0GAK3_9CUCU|nr:unnamed protein product [Psylliodes chrysocephala]
METYNSPKQCDIQQQIPANDNFNNYYQSVSLLKNNDNLDYGSVMDEPIDLTVSPTDLTYTHNKSVNDVSFTCYRNRNNRNYKSVNKKHAPRLEPEPFQTVNCHEKMYANENRHFFCPSRRKKRRKFVYTNEGKLVLLTENLSPPTFTQAKQAEILKAAKSLFSKRTRTLYHWMYPNASKQHIKMTVMTSWDSLAENEKAFYISQVLGRFGLSQTNLMVNPQLETIKEPPPHTDRIVTRTKSRELQSAISSISPETNTSDPVSMTFEEFEAMNEKTRKKRGRPKGRNEIRQKAKGTNGDFQDDPELSLELEKFAVQFNLNRLY